MKKSFITHYVGGLANLAKPTPITLTVNNDLRQAEFKTLTEVDKLNFEDITEVSFDEKTTRSAGKAAAGALIGGVLTGGIGLVAGGVLGARKKDKSILYIGYKKGDKQFEVLLRTGKKSEEIYAYLSSAIATPEVEGFDREAIVAAQEAEQANKPPANMPAGCVILFIVLITAAVLAFVFWVKS